VDFNPSTFVLEVINFLILVWILRRYLYRPVAAVIEARRVSIQQSVDEARAREARAEELERQYADRLAAWESEKSSAREAWLGELNAEKGRMMEAFKQGLQTERQQAEVLDRRRLQAQQADVERQAMGLGAQFAARLLERLSGPELEARLLDVFIEDLCQVPEDRWQAAIARTGDGSGQPLVVSAFPLSDSQRADFQQAISAQFGKPVECRFAVDTSLIAGLRFELGPLSLHANLRDELEFFRGEDKP
jgi:F-type H+-transporting ATPase subunit b